MRCEIQKELRYFWHLGIYSTMLVIGEWESWLIGECSDLIAVDSERSSGTGMACRYATYAFI